MNIEVLGGKNEIGGNKIVYVCLNSKKVNTIVSEDHHFSNKRNSLLAKGIRLLDL